MNKLALLPVIITLILGYSSCTKTNNINNGSVIATPYALFFTDSLGSLYKTNNGTQYDVLFTSDGYYVRSIITQDENIIVAKTLLQMSANNGRSFNPVNQYVKAVSKVAVNGRKFDLNQSMMIYSKAFKQSYVASTDPSVKNVFGIAYNNQGGKYNTWLPDDYYDTLQVTHILNNSVTSFTELKNGTLVAYDGQNVRTFYRTAYLSRWRESNMSSSNALPDTMQAFFSIGHLNNRLFAIDNIGNRGIYFSDDFGVNWFTVSGIPAATPLMCIESPFEEICLVGTDGKGLYKLNPNTNVFEPCNNGLPTNCVVRNIAFKENIFKDGTKKQYVYLATNSGIYQSTDKGNSFVLTIPGNYVNVY